MIIDYTMIWLVFGILLLLSEFIIPGFTIFFFGLGAIITWALMLIIPPLQNIFWLQIGIFLITSIILLFAMRKKFKKTLRGEIFNYKKDAIGIECKVIETVYVDKPGRIEYQGTTWSAYAKESTIKKNQRAIIIDNKDNDPMIFIIDIIK